MWNISPCPPVTSGDSTLGKVSSPFGTHVPHRVCPLSENQENRRSSGFVPTHQQGPASMPKRPQQVSSPSLYALGGSSDHDTPATRGWLKTLDRSRLALREGQGLCLMSLICHL